MSNFLSKLSANSMYMKKLPPLGWPYAWAALGLVILAPFLFTGCSANGKSAQAAGGRRGEGGGPVPVTVATVSQRDVPIDIQVIGNVEAYSTISVKAQVGGQLTRVFFREGDFVKKGDPLFTI